MTNVNVNYSIEVINEVPTCEWCIGTYKKHNEEVKLDRKFITLSNISLLDLDLNEIVDCIEMIRVYKVFENVNIYLS